MAHSITLAVMAAGIGSRFDGQKQWASIGPHGEALLDYAIHDALGAGFDRVVLIIREEHEATLRQRMRDTVGDRCAVEFACQKLTDLPEGFAAPGGREKPWGTGHAVWSCRHLIDGPFAVINADDFYGREGFVALARFLKTSRDRTATEQAMVGYRLDHTLSEFGTVSRGVCTVSAAGLLTAIVERHRVGRRAAAIAASEDGECWIELPPDATVSINLWGFDPSIFGALERRFVAFLAQLGGAGASSEFALSTEIGRLVEAADITVRVLPTGERWFGLTYREDLERARAEIESRIAVGEYPATPWRSA
ncbi:NTP transferase domain-containing protein [Candidatus Bipolaricaulota bacterium]|nr:NTP transferase domain-containing protein [Candidatus Bipolaricaulota bacterium]